jgi:hypothetical protein
MSWDSNRVVPWRRLIREAALFGAAMVLLFGLIAKPDAGAYVGLALGLVLYVLLMAALAKVGYTRKTLADLRAEREAAAAANPPPAAVPAPRGRPAPTKRTGGGQRKPAAKRRR